ncbi:MAG TPA: VOC family protein [Candidatus Nanoarchaeia archaeon]|nr:VOC family protein [Candidatus Nanoarchaeia archaeon]
MKPNFIDHIVVWVKDVERTAIFYSTFLGTPIQKEKEVVAWKIGDTKVFFGLPYEEKENCVAFDKENIGLNHLAFGVRTLEELKQWEQTLNNAHIKHSGIKICPYSKKEFIWFDDPDGIRLEFYLRPKD